MQNIHIIAAANFCQQFRQRVALEFCRVSIATGCAICNFFPRGQHAAISVPQKRFKTDLHIRKKLQFL